MSITDRQRHPIRKVTLWVLSAALGVTSFAVAETYTYDDLGRVSSVTQNGKTTDYQYDAVGNRTSIVTATQSQPNSPPYCGSSTIIMNIPSYVGPQSVSVPESMILSICQDTDGDTLTVTKPTSLPYSISVAAGQTVVVSFEVADGKGGKASGTLSYKRP